MRLVDWRELPARRLEPVWADQRRRWLDMLSWDSARNWSEVEAQRAAGRLPGLAVLDGDAVLGWLFYLVHEDTLQIGAVEADASTTTRLLLDTVLAATGAGDAPAGALLFAFSAAPGLVPALVARGFAVEPYRYLARDLDDKVRPTARFAWHPGDAAQLPDLLAGSYGPASSTRPFARGDRPEEWRHYAAQLLGSMACGRFVAPLSAADIGPDGRLGAAIVTTAVAPDTVHIAQVAVAPWRRGTGLATTMLDDVLARARMAGYGRATLLVSDRNPGAIRIYRRAGFSETATFVSAGRGAYPRRSTSPALETGGASILR